MEFSGQKVAPVIGIVSAGMFNGKPFRKGDLDRPHVIVGKIPLLGTKWGGNVD
jgi:hypothetical protein